MIVRQKLNNMLNNFIKLVKIDLINTRIFNQSFYLKQRNRLIQDKSYGIKLLIKNAKVVNVVVMASHP